MSLFNNKEVLYMAVKCIALDLDGTTLINDRSTTDKNIQAIKRAVNKGVHIVVASGRCFYSLPDFLKQLGCIEYAITSNGAAVYDYINEDCIMKSTLPYSAIEKIFELTKNINVTYEAFIDGKGFAPAEYIADPAAFGVAQGYIDYIKQTREGTDDFKGLLYNNKYNIDSFDVIFSDKSLFKTSFELFNKSIDGVYFTSSGSDRIEISSENAGKHNGLKFVLERIGVSPDETAAFGDADNDIDMLTYVKYGFAVANASESCLKAAPRIVSKNTQSGVAMGIEELENNGLI